MSPGLDDDGLLLAKVLVLVALEGQEVQVGRRLVRQDNVERQLTENLAGTFFSGATRENKYSGVSYAGRPL